MSKELALLKYFRFFIIHYQLSVRCPLSIVTYLFSIPKITAHCALSISSKVTTQTCSVLPVGFAYYEYGLKKPFY
jgi:hypothetical protein